MELRLAWTLRPVLGLGLVAGVTVTVKTVVAAGSTDAGLAIH